METEENKSMEALAYVIANLKAENIVLAHRVHQLVDDYNDVVRQLNEEKRPRRLVKAFYAFVKDKNLYMKKGDGLSLLSRQPSCMLYILLGM